MQFHLGDQLQEQVDSGREIDQRLGRREESLDRGGGELEELLRHVAGRYFDLLRHDSVPGPIHVQLSRRESGKMDRPREQLEHTVLEKLRFRRGARHRDKDQFLEHIRPAARLVLHRERHYHGQLEEVEPVHRSSKSSEQMDSQHGEAERT